MATDFIRSYPNVIDADCIEFLIDLANQTRTWSAEGSANRNDKHRKDSQVNIQLDPTHQGVNNYITKCLIDNVFNPYAAEFPYLSMCEEWSSAITLLTKIEPDEGYHTFHCEDLTYDSQSRHLAWMIYLNDVEEGGETEFLYQSKRIKPKRGMGLVWPGSFTHLHRGNPPMSTKYTLTGWFVASSGQIRWS